MDCDVVSSHFHGAYARMSNTAGHDNHKKIKSWVSFALHYRYVAPLLGQWSFDHYKYHTVLPCPGYFSPRLFQHEFIDNKTLLMLSRSLY